MKYTVGNGVFSSFPTILTGDRDILVNGVAVDSHGNIFVAGNFGGTLNPGNGGVTAQGFADAFLAKYSPGRTLVWFKHFPAFGSNIALQVAVDPNDDIFCSVQFQTAFSFGDSVTWTPHAGSRDFGIGKFQNGDGMTLWSKAWGSDGYDAPIGLDTFANGNVIVTGRAGGPIDLGGGMVSSGG